MSSIAARGAAALVPIILSIPLAHLTGMAGMNCSHAGSSPMASLTGAMSLLSYQSAQTMRSSNFARSKGQSAFSGQQVYLLARPNRELPSSIGSSARLPSRLGPHSMTSSAASNMPTKTGVGRTPSTSASFCLLMSARMALRILRAQSTLCGHGSVGLSLKFPPAHNHGGNE